MNLYKKTGKEINGKVLKRESINDTGAIKNTIKVSIIVPVCNVERYLSECLDSVIHQTLDDIEIICVNDGSTDNSLKILREYEKKDARIKVVTKDNSGYGNTMNVGIDAAKGKYIGIVESDDYVEKNMFERLYETAELYQSEIVKSDHYIFSTKDGYKKSEYQWLCPIEYYNRILNGEKILNVDFRDKSVYKWSTTATVYLESGKVVRQDYKDCFWYKGFLEGVINRENCSNCPYARTERCADFTMGDAWQISKINPSYNDQMGTSLILANSTKAEYILDIIKNRFSLCEKIELEEIRKYNGNLNTPQKMAATREYFFSHLKKDGFHKALWYGRGLRWDVGIVGWWFASNYGSVLTYYVLAKSIQKNGKNIIFIPIPRVDGEKWDADTLEAERFISKHFKIAAKRDINHLKEVNHFCDSFILGSDQMWTESTTKLVGYSFFLDFVDKKKKKIACATSFGASNFLSDVKMQYTARDYLKQFDAVSVREESAVEVCRNAFGIIPEQI
ncbi:MAG: glycosyltransferase, partial [Lachnospiraceae bacterium]|nr:glycosyltransferase [Lachnospiraceae bacterium]